MTRYVCFKDRGDPDGVGTWYEIVPTPAYGKGVYAKNVYPYPRNGREFEIFGHEQSTWDRTEYDEEDVPGELWAAIAAQSLLA